MAEKERSLGSTPRSFVAVQDRFSMRLVVESAKNQDSDAGSVCSFTLMWRLSISQVGIQCNLCIK